MIGPEARFGLSKASIAAKDLAKSHVNTPGTPNALSRHILASARLVFEQNILALQDSVDESVLDGRGVLDGRKGEAQGGEDRGPQAESLEAELVRVRMALDVVARTVVDVPRVSVCCAWWLEEGPSASIGWACSCLSLNEKREGTHDVILLSALLGISWALHSFVASSAC